MANVTFCDADTVEVPANVKPSKSKAERSAETMEKALNLCRAKRVIKLQECHELKAAMIDCQNRNKTFSKNYRNICNRFNRATAEVKRLEADIAFYAVNIYS